ncbi:MAG: hypothetical protein ABFS35_21880 [Bacteroidota bacterium]
MDRTIDVKIGKTVFKFIETVYEADKLFYIKYVHLVHKSHKIKMVIMGEDHNPPHIHIYYLVYDFRFKLETKDYYKNDISGNEGFIKLKNNKILYNAIIEYFNLQKNNLIESFYIFNPTLKTK